MSDSNDLDCSEIIEFLDDYVDKKLPEDRTILFEEHLSICSDCVDYLNSYQQTIAASNNIRRIEQVAESAPPDLVAAILAAQRIG